jgi:hypothetical protein
MRLEGIDAPDPQQTGGKQATEELSKVRAKAGHVLRMTSVTDVADLSACSGVLTGAVAGPIVRARLMSGVTLSDRAKPGASNAISAIRLPPTERRLRCKREARKKPRD